MFNVNNNSYFNNEQFHNCSRTFKDAENMQGRQNLFSRIKGIISFDSKFKESPWRSRTSGNLSWIGLF